MHSRDPSIEVGERYQKITTNISVRAMPLSHGKTVSQHAYQSLAFFVRHNLTKEEFLFFGDVEPDSHSQKGTTKAVFRAAAPLIVAEQLNTIFLECSYPIGRNEQQLFGHLSPIHFVEELRSLAQEVSDLRAIAHSAQSPEPRSNDQPPQKRRRSIAPDSEACEGSLAGVSVYVIHCKEPMEEIDDPRPIAQFIVSQINCLAEEYNLGVTVMAAEQGMRICEISPFQALRTETHTETRYLVSMGFYNLNVFGHVSLYVWYLATSGHLLYPHILYR